MRAALNWCWLLFAAAVMTGCATAPNSKSSSLSLFKPQQPAKSEKQEAESTSEVAAKISNPFRKASNNTQPTDASPPAEKSKVETAKVDPPSVKRDEPKVETSTPARDHPSEGRRPGVFGPETLRMIDAELTDATPEERAYWYDQLKKVDPAVIPQILQARRLTAQVAERQKSSRFDEAGSEGSFPRGGQSFSVDSSVQPASRDAVEETSAPVVNAGGMSKAERHPTRENESENPPPRFAAVLQNDPSSGGESGKKSFAVTRIADAVSEASPTGSTGRHPLTRFLPMGTQATANSPSGVSLLPPSGVEPNDTNAPLQQLISRLEADIPHLQPGTTEASRTEYVKRHVELRMLYLMADHPERALTAIPGIDSADQEFWQQLLWAMANYFDIEHIPSAKDRAGQSVAQLTTATQRLREKADLEIKNLAFCREIAYFGNIVRFPRDEFRPGDSALVYAEIENFKSELTIDGQYRTLLRSTLEILSPSGEVRWHKEFPATEDLCLNHRRDYFHNYQFTFPERLPLGPHTLKLTVFDELSGKMVSQSLNFIVR